jgi:single-strand DNA-binding protein
MNVQIAAGNLAKHATVHANTAGDREFMVVTIACNEGKDKEGNQRPAEFIDAIVWGKKGAFDNSKQYFVKGQPVLATGKLVYPDFQEKDGVRYEAALIEVDSLFDLELTGSMNGNGRVTDVGSDVPQRADGADQAANSGVAQVAQAAPQPAPDFDSFDDDIPFDLGA